MSVDSVDTTVLNGVYSKSGNINKKPRYVHSTTSGVEINYTGNNWALLQNGESLATSLSDNSPTSLFNVPVLNWVVAGRDTANMVVSTTENLDFLAGERITGNISAGEATVISSSNDIVTVNNLEQLYAEDELVTGKRSNRTRTVFSTRNT